jgi:tRNA 2-selenouridine synthase
MSAPLPPGPPPRHAELIDVDALADYPDRIDVRSPAEFAEDHIPGAVNLPVLSDAERAEVGTIYVQQSAFEARKRGAAIVARNIARIVETLAPDHGTDWRPLVYCWRGGQRSGALAHVMNEIGWRTARLRGGYRAYRRHVVSELASLPAAFDYRVVCGLTGSGKSRLIDALAEEGAQVLDLEGLARHRGSLLGDLPDAPQPSQKAFESSLLAALQRFDRRRIAFVESESRRIGALQVPEALLAAMRRAPCVRIETPLPLRVALLHDEYAHLIEDPASIARLLAPLGSLHGKKVIERWNSYAVAGQHDELVRELLQMHYDPIYSRSIAQNFPRSAEAPVFRIESVERERIRALARDIIGEMSPLPSTA